jgi:hypothetical protein
VYTRKCKGVNVRRDRLPSKATISNKSRPARSFLQLARPFVLYASKCSGNNYYINNKNNNFLGNVHKAISGLNNRNNIFGFIFATILFPNIIKIFAKPRICLQ